MIPLARPQLGPPELEGLAQVLSSGWLTQGSRVERFERLVAEYCGVRHAVACSSCTAALHMALLTLGVGPGDEVITPALSFIATANAIVHCGARPVFADVELQTGNLDPRAAEQAITPRTKAILPVHQLGMPADLDALHEVGRRHGLPIVEDAACALGSRYRGRPIGGHSPLVCFSFHPRKVITTGEGGMVLTNDETYARRLRLLRHHGMSVSDAERHGATALIIEHYLCIGYNYRMSDLHAALGIAQMGRLDELLERRRVLAGRYDRALAGIPHLEIPRVPEYAEPNYQSYAVRLTRDAPLSRNALLKTLLARGIAAKPGVMTIYREPAYGSGCNRSRASDDPAPHRASGPGHDRAEADRNGKPGRRCPNSEELSDQSLLLPLYPDLSEAEQDQVIAALRQALQGESDCCQVGRSQRCPA